MQAYVSEVKPRPLRVVGGGGDGLGGGVEYIPQELKLVT